MKRQKIVTNWREGKPPEVDYVDEGPSRVRISWKAGKSMGHVNAAGGGVHFRGTKNPPACS